MSDSLETEQFSGELVASLDPAGVAVEAYRTLRTNLFYSFVDDPPRIISVTSPGPGEGKSTTCANLGVVLAQAGKSTLIMDCDLRRPAMHKIFGLRNFKGIADVLTKSVGSQEITEEPLPGLKVLTAGPIPPQPAEILGSNGFAEFLGRVRKEFDYVLMDTPPVEVVSDPLILATQSDGVLLVVDARNTRKAAVRRSMRNLRGVEATVLGTVMNNIETSRREYYGGRYESYAYGG